MTALGLASLLLAGCTSSSGSRGGTPAAQAKNVELKDMASSPPLFTVAAGTTVKWTDAEDMPHDVTGAGGAWQSTGGPGAMNKGAVFTKRFDAPGVYEYYGTLHSAGPGNGMSGKVIVE